jgi:hypothetical protein
MLYTGKVKAEVKREVFEINVGPESGTFLSSYPRVSEFKSVYTY